MTPEQEPAGFDTDLVAALSTTPIPFTAKGFGGVPPGDATTARELVTARARIFDGTFTFPLLTVHEHALAHNVAQLARFCADSGVRLAPHAKTTMAPQIFARQLRAGAWGLTVATTGQAQLCREFGVRRLLLANELVDPAGIGWLAGELARDPAFEAYCYVDSPAGVRLLDGALTHHRRGSDPAGLARRLRVLVELGFAGGRAGCRDADQAVAVARAAAATETLEVAGVAGFEGGIGRDRSDRALAAVEAFCARLVDLSDLLAKEHVIDGRPIVSAGGSAYPDVVATALSAVADRATVVLRSGCYVTHDDGEYARLSPFTAAGASPYALESALELWTQVVSLPEPGLAILGAGRRDAGFDQGFPVPLLHRCADGTVRPLARSGAAAARLTRLDDQHAYLALPPRHELRVGDFVSLGVSHPCTTLDRWTHVVQVGDDDLVTDVVRTYF